MLKSLYTQYGMLVVLAVLCALFSVLTLTEQGGSGRVGGEQLAKRIAAEAGADARVLIVTQDLPADLDFSDSLQNGLEAAGLTVLPPVNGTPRDARLALEALSAEEQAIDVIAAPQKVSRWLVFADQETEFPGIGSPQLLSPERVLWPVFLNADNLLNIANQIVVIAIIAIGMTMVIITAGIDLSVGSLIALSAVISCLLIERVAGGTGASTAAMIGACAVGIACSAAVGAFSGAMVTLCGIPPFIVTLAMMLVASGSAALLTSGESVYKIPDAFVWLGRGTNLGLPNAVWLMLILYAVAHVVMARTVLGRYLYAVGGNPEAARLSGVPVKRVILFAYVMSGLLAGLGGVLMASQLKSASPNYGQMYELYVIAAVVVGGTSLSGGEGKVLGTLIGAFIIAVIQNGMNLMKVEPFTQKVVLGAVILAAVLLDTLKHKGWFQSKRPAAG